MGDEDAVEEAAAELYRLPPAAFTAARDSLVKQARTDGDRGLAERIKQLRRPTAAAWLANLLVREQREQVEQLLELGAALREAQQTLAGEDLLALSRQRQLVVAALGREARHLAAATGSPVPAEAGIGLEDTLRAALADDRAAQLLRSGRLTTALHPDAGGFDLTAAPARPPAASSAASAPAGGVRAPASGAAKRPAARTSRASRAVAAGPSAVRRERAERERAEQRERERERERERLERQRAAALAAVAAAEREADEAEQGRVAAEAALQRQHDDLASLQRRLAELQAETDRARAEESLSQRELRRLQARLDAAGQAAQQTATRAAQARAALDRLPG